MRFCTFRRPDGFERAGWLHGNSHVVDMYEVSGGKLPKRLIGFLEDAVVNEQIALDLETKLSEAIRETSNAVKIEDEMAHPDHGGRAPRPAGVYGFADVELLAPLPRPASVRDFYAFEDHVKTARDRRGLEMVPQWYEFPVFYFSNHQAICGPGDAVEIPEGCAWFDYELEIACVIGRQGRNISVETAESYIFGYCVMNDWSARDIQREEVKVGLGPAKGKDFATSLGPYLVTPDELRHRQAGERMDLAMTASVNGRLLSQGNYKDIYYPFPELIAQASKNATLYPGDVIGSGTVGTGCILELGTEVHRWLQPGDEVELSIEGLGTLRNRVMMRP